MKVLDPAMGSASFLLRAFDYFVRAYDRYNEACRQHKNGLRASSELHDAPASLFDLNAGIPEEIFKVATRVLTENIFGVDLDSQAVEVARMSLWLRVLERERRSFRETLQLRRHTRRFEKLLPGLKDNLKRGNSLIPDAAVAGDAAFDWQKEFPQLARSSRRKEALTSSLGAGKNDQSLLTSAATEQRAESSGGLFDCVIGNPPYERIQTMTGNSPAVVDFLKANYRSASSGNFDIYVCFIERGLELLRHGGHFGYICPHKFFQAEYGQPVRKLLSEGRHVRHILSFGDQQVFPQVSTYTCLLMLEKERQENVRVIKVEDIAGWRAGNASLEGIFPAGQVGEAEWNFTLGDAAPLFSKLLRQPAKLETVATRLYQGPITSADNVFLFEEHRPVAKKSVTEVFSVALQRWVALERKILKRVVRSGSIGRYWASADALVLFPYGVKKGAAELLSPVKLRQQFTLAWNYLCENRETLESREGGSFRDEDWYRFGRTQNLAMWELPKLMLPYMVTELGAYYDPTDEFYFINVTTGGYGLTCDAEKVRLPYLCALLNSPVLDFFLKQVSTNFRGGYFAANKQFLDKLPIKLIDPKKRKEVRLEQEIIKRVDAIQAAHRQRLALPAALDRKIRHSQSRTPCSLAHYLHADYAGAVKAEPLIDDVQRRGFVHRIQIDAENGDLTLGATVAADAKAEPKRLPVLRLRFTNEPLREFVHALWRRFLEENSRKQKWTTGKKPDEIYPLLVNTLEPLVSFHAAATDNLRAIREIMKQVAAEAGTSNLAAVEAEITRLDDEINQRVFELYELTPEEITLVTKSRR